MNLTKKQLTLLCRFQKQEITGYKMYQRLAKRQKDEHNRKVLLNIAEDEIKHYNVYKSFTGKDVGANQWQIFIYTLSAVLLGPTFSINLWRRVKKKHRQTMLN
jgi:predicted SprT family Zn-dependent metalloprotease